MLQSEWETVPSHRSHGRRNLGVFLVWGLRQVRRRNQPEAKRVNSCLQINTFLRLIETFRQLAASPTVKQQTIKIKWDAVPKPGVTLLQAEGKPAEMLVNTRGHRTSANRDSEAEQEQKDDGAEPCCRGSSGLIILSSLDRWSLTCVHTHKHTQTEAASLVCWQVVSNVRTIFHHGAHTPPRGRRQTCNCRALLGRPNAPSDMPLCESTAQRQLFSTSTIACVQSDTQTLWRGLNIAANRNKGKGGLRRGG